MGRVKGSTVYDEEKTAALYAMLTPTALRNLDKKIFKYDRGISRSEFLERLGRGTLEPLPLLRIFFCDFYTQLLSYIPKSSGSRRGKD